MAKALFHSLLLMMYVVFATTAQVHAMPEEPPEAPSPMVNMSHEHHAMMHSENAMDKAQTNCCDYDCSCQMGHCHKAPTVLPSVTLSFQGSSFERLTDEAMTVVYSNTHPRKQPPKV